MKKSTLLIALLASFLSTAQMCGSRDEVNPKNACFSTESLNSVFWQKDQLTYFQRPKSGSLRVVVYTYEGESFLAFENVAVSSPMSYIFDCSGTTIAKRNINYNAFHDAAKKAGVLLEGKY